MLKLFLLITLVLSINLLAQSYSIVCSSKSLHIHKDDIKNIYLKKLTQKDGISIIPINLKYSNALRKYFMQKILRIDAQEWDSYYDELHFIGVRTPLVLESNAAILKFLERFEGVIAYIPSKYVSKQFIEIDKFEF